LIYNTQRGQKINMTIIKGEAKSKETIARHKMILQSQQRNKLIRGGSK